MRSGLRGNPYQEWIWGSKTPEGQRWERRVRKTRLLHEELKDGDQTALEQYLEAMAELDGASQHIWQNGDCELPSEEFDDDDCRCCCCKQTCSQ
jgi:hypothetical protein